MKKAIYKITNNINGMSYIGQSNNPQNRWKQHISVSKSKGNDKKSYIHNAIHKFGVDNFTFSIIGWFDDYNDKEKYYIKEYNTLYPNGYNLTDGGEEPPHKYGEEHHCSVYQNKLVDCIIEDLLQHKYTQKEIEIKYNVPQHLVTYINVGKIHRRCGMSYPIIKTSKYHCNENQFNDIVYLLKNSQCTCQEIGKYFGFSTSAIKAINSGRNDYHPNIKYPIRNFRGKANSQSVETILANRSTKSIDTALEMQICTN